MPIQKDRSKDIPGKDGYSVRDIEKIVDVLQHPEKVDGWSDKEKDGCFKQFLNGLFIVGMIVLYVTTH